MELSFLHVSKRKTALITCGKNKSLREYFSKRPGVYKTQRVTFVRGLC